MQRSFYRLLSKERLLQALNLLSIPEEEVIAWLGEPCDCEDRRRKERQLINWYTQVLIDPSIEYRDHLRALWSIQ